MKDELAKLLAAADILYENAEYNLHSSEGVSLKFMERALNDFRLARHAFVEAAKKEGIPS